MKKQISRRAVSLRPPTPADEKFLAEVFIESVREEFAAAGFDELTLKTFLESQFQFQQQAYKMQFPGADAAIVEYAQRSAGRLIVWRRETEIRLVNIALLPEFRGRGIGTFLIESLQAEAARKSGAAVVLKVLKTNLRAIELYRRCGFEQTADGDDAYLAMRWRPADPSEL